MRMTVSQSPVVMRHLLKTCPHWRVMKMMLLAWRRWIKTVGTEAGWCNIRHDEEMMVMNCSGVPAVWSSVPVLWLAVIKEDSAATWRLESAATLAAAHLGPTKQKRGGEVTTWTNIWKNGSKAVLGFAFSFLNWNKFLHPFFLTEIAQTELKAKCFSVQVLVIVHFMFRFRSLL